MGNLKYTYFIENGTKHIVLYRDINGVEHTVEISFDERMTNFDKFKSIVNNNLNYLIDIKIFNSEPSEEILEEIWYNTQE